MHRSIRFSFLVVASRPTVLIERAAAAIFIRQTGPLHRGCTWQGGYGRLLTELTEDVDTMTPKDIDRTRVNKQCATELAADIMPLLALADFLRGR